MDFRLRFDLRSEEEVEEGSGGEEGVRFRGDLRSCGGCGCGIGGLGREESSERRALVRLRGDRRTIFIFKLPFLHRMIGVGGGVTAVVLFGLLVVVW